MLKRKFVTKVEKEKCNLANNYPILYLVPKTPCQHFTCLISFNPHNHRMRYCQCYPHFTKGTANVTLHTKNCHYHSHFIGGTATITHTSQRRLPVLPTLHMTDCHCYPYFTHWTTLIIHTLHEELSPTLHTTDCHCYPHFK